MGGQSDDKKRTRDHRELSFATPLTKSGDLPTKTMLCIHWWDAHRLVNGGAINEPPAAGERRRDIVSFSTAAFHAAQWEDGHNRDAKRTAYFSLNHVKRMVSEKGETTG